MIHQLIFSKLLGEVDYGAGGIGDFNAAGCVTKPDAFNFFRAPSIFCSRAVVQGTMARVCVGRNACGLFLCSLRTMLLEDQLQATRWVGFLCCEV